MSIGLATISPDPAQPAAADAKRLLAELLRPGHRRLAAAGGLTVAVTAATAAAFFGISAVAEDVLAGDVSWAHEARWLVLMTAGAVGRAAAAYLASRLAFEGGAAVEQHLRARVLERLLDGAGASLNGAVQTTAVMDEAEHVASYAERYIKRHESQRRSFPCCCSPWCFPSTGLSGYCWCCAFRWPR